LRKRKAEPDNDGQKANVSSRVTGKADQQSEAVRLSRRGAVGEGEATQDRQYLLRPDESLMSLVERNDSQAFTVLYNRHGRAAYSLAYRLMGNKQAAEDLTQDAFLKVWRSAGTYRADRSSVRTWILSVVHNRGIDQLRSSASRRRMQEKVEMEAPRFQPSEAFAETWRGAQRDQVRRAMARLSPEQTESLSLAYFQGYTHAEIARLLELPIGTVKGRIRLGLKKVRAYFDSCNIPVPR
jgi:RNA polymerase sigma-70 factor (ECF subfamily)